MRPVPRMCRQCSREFFLTPTKPGHINDCPICSVEIVVKFMAKVAYPSKNSCEVEIELTQDHASARAFNKSQRRSSGGSPLSSIIASREPKSGQESRKIGSGAENGAMYFSPLGEKRVVK